MCTQPLEVTKRLVIPAGAQLIAGQLLTVTGEGSIQVEGLLSVECCVVQGEGAISVEEGDVYKRQTHGLLAVVADGMGGLSGGERISQLVVQAVLDAFLSAWKEENPCLLYTSCCRCEADRLPYYFPPLMAARIVFLRPSNWLL